MVCRRTARDGDRSQSPPRVLTSVRLERDNGTDAARRIAKGRLEAADEDGNLLGEESEQLLIRAGD
jgi:hypothetical protein